MHQNSHKPKKTRSVYFRYFLTSEQCGQLNVKLNKTQKCAGSHFKAVNICTQIFHLSRDAEYQLL